MKINRIWILVLFILVGISSCHPNRVFEQNQDIPDNVWDRNFQPAFEFNVQDTQQLYVLSVNVRHANFYQFNNLWVMISTDFPDNTHLESRVELPLAENSGKWHGSCIGNICDVTVFIQKKTRFNQLGVHKFRFEQIMRNKTLNIEQLPGIMSFGLKIEKLVDKN